MGKTQNPKDPTHVGLLRALGHPLRLTIMRLLMQSEEGSALSPLELSRQANRPLSNVSYHVRVLAECEAVTLVRTRPRRGSTEHFYRPSKMFVRAGWVMDVLNMPVEAEPA